ncbi:hypothetical protein M3906_003354 [Vibrio metschnikovii]|nr:hypothetical protein [Vibrio metschnikovii]
MFNISTDSLYKFLACLGVFIVFNSFRLGYVEFNKFGEFDSQIVEIKKELEVKSMLVQMELDSIKQELRYLDNVTNDGVNVTENSVNKLRELFEKQRNLLEALRAVVSDKTPELSKVEIKKKYSSYYIFAFVFSACFGSVLATYGIIKWREVT